MDIEKRLKKIEALLILTNYNLINQFYKNNRSANPPEIWSVIEYNINQLEDWLENQDANQPGSPPPEICFDYDAIKSRL